MKDGKNEFLGLLCNLYLVVLLVVLPLYTGKGYWQLGDTKYTLFRNLSFLCLGGWLLAGMPGRVGSAAGYLRMWKEHRKVQESADARTGPREDRAVGRGQRGREIAGQKLRGGRGIGQKQAVFSSMDFAMMIYGICVVLSAACSAYGKLAWVGYDGWYMGAVSQFLFIGIYFFVSRQYDGAAWPVYLGEAALFVVTLLGLLHRLGIDPLGLMGSWKNMDWEYSHMLSTLGNINWLCGYYSVVTAFVIVHYLQEKKLWLRAVWYLVSVFVFVLLLIQGSQSGLLILGSCVTVCLFLGKQQSGVWEKVFLLLAGTFLFMPLMEMLMRLQGSKAAVVADGNIFAYTSWHGWMLAAVICLFVFLLLERKGSVFRESESAMERGKPEKIPAGGDLKGHKCNCTRKTSWLIALAVLGTVIVLTMAGLLFWSRLDDSYGSGRGFLWRIAVESFIEADGKDKLLGAGPDCYGEAVFNRLGADTDVWKGEHWEGAVFTNAHNEILSQLCNVGILGTASYLVIFLTGLRRYGGNCREYGGNRRERGGQGAGSCKEDKGSWQFYGRDVGLLALVMYGIHSLVSFQQVLNAPLLFLVLGLCEAEKRQNR